MTNVELVSLVASIASLVLAAFTIYWSDATNRDTSSLLREMHALQSAIRERLEFVANTTAKTSERMLDSMLNNSSLVHSAPHDVPLAEQALISDEDPKLAFGITRAAFESFRSESFSLAVGLELSPDWDAAAGALAELIRGRAPEMAAALEKAQESFTPFKARAASSITVDDLEPLRDSYAAIRKASQSLAIMSGFAMRGSLSQPTEWK